MEGFGFRCWSWICSELLGLHTGYLLAPDKIEIKGILSNFQLKVAGFYNIPIGNGNKRAQVCVSLWILSKIYIYIYIRLGLSLKNKSSIRIQSIAMAKLTHKN